MGTHHNFTFNNLFQQNWLKKVILTLQAPPAMEINITLQRSWNATTFFVDPPTTLHTKDWIVAMELPPCKHHMDALQNPQPDPCSAIHHMIFVFPAFTLRPFFSILSFQYFLTFSNNNSFDSGNQNKLKQLHRQALHEFPRQSLQHDNEYSRGLRTEPQLVHPNLYIKSLVLPRSHSSSPLSKHPHACLYITDTILTSCSNYTYRTKFAYFYSVFCFPIRDWYLPPMENQAPELHQRPQETGISYGNRWKDCCRGCLAIFETVHSSSL